MSTPFQDRVAKSAALVAFAVASATGGGPFQDSVADPGQDLLRRAGRSSFISLKDGAAQACDDGFRQFVLAFRVEGEHGIHGSDRLHVAQLSPSNWLCAIR